MTDRVLRLRSRTTPRTKPIALTPPGRQRVACKTDEAIGSVPFVA
jgi:hypothetical protein